MTTPTFGRMRAQESLCQLQKVISILFCHITKTIKRHAESIWRILKNNTNKNTKENAEKSENFAENSKEFTKNA